MRGCCSRRLPGHRQPAPFSEVLEEHQDYRLQRILECHSSASHSLRYHRQHATSARFIPFLVKSNGSRSLLIASPINPSNKKLGGACEHLHLRSKLTGTPDLFGRSVRQGKE